MPLAFVLTLVLMSQGAIQTLRGDTVATTIDASAQITTQHIPGGPFASQEAIKELGSNGGGPYNANSSHPFENPNGFTDWLEVYVRASTGAAVVGGDVRETRR